MADVNRGKIGAEWMNGTDIVQSTSLRLLQIHSLQLQPTTLIGELLNYFLIQRITLSENVLLTF